MKKLVKESLNEGADYPEIDDTAIRLQRTLGFKLDKVPDDQDGYLGYEYQDDEEAMGFGYEIKDIVNKVLPGRGFPFALTLDVRGGFQFWAETMPIPTKHNTADEKKEMWQSLIAAPVPVSKLDKETYLDVVKTYKKMAKDIA